MNQETANYIMQRLSKYLDNSQTIKLKDTLDESLRQSEEKILEKDSNPALFVTIRKPHHRLKAGGVEITLKNMGEDCNVNHVHPHKFRRTMATTAIDKGMPIEQVQHLLGHEKIDTTLHYAMVKQSNVKMAHKKYIG